MCKKSRQHSVVVIFFLFAKKRDNTNLCATSGRFRGATLIDLSRKKREEKTLPQTGYKILWYYKRDVQKKKKTK